MRIEIDLKLEDLIPYLGDEAADILRLLMDKMRKPDSSLTYTYTEMLIERLLGDMPPTPHWIGYVLVENKDLINSLIGTDGFDEFFETMEEE